MASAWGDSWGVCGDVGTGTGGCDPPDTPVLSVNSAGTLATITGSTTGSANAIDVASFSYTVGSQTWSYENTRTGDGTAALTLTDGYYWARVTSTTSGGASVSNLYFFRVGVAPTGTVHSPADVVRWLLIAQGLLTDPDDLAAWPAFVANEPTSPDNVATLFDTAGNLFGREQVGQEMQEHYGVSIRLRSQTHPLGWTKTKALAEALDEDTMQDIVTIGSSQYCVKSVRRTSGISAIGNESPASKRRIFTLNVVVHLTVIV